MNLVLASLLLVAQLGEVHGCSSEESAAPIIPRPRYGSCGGSELGLLRWPWGRSPQACCIIKDGC